MHKPKFDRNGLVRCRVCGCTDLDACANSCAWVDGQDLCTTCRDAAAAIREWRETARRPMMTRLLAEVGEMERLDRAGTARGKVSVVKVLTREMKRLERAGTVRARKAAS